MTFLLAAIHLPGLGQMELAAVVAVESARRWKLLLGCDPEIVIWKSSERRPEGHLGAGL